MVVWGLLISGAMFFSSVAAWSVQLGFLKPVDWPVVHFQSEVVYFNHTSGNKELYPNNCTGFIVGNNPVTIMTASHCLNEAPIYKDTGRPRIDLNLAGTPYLGKKLTPRLVLMNPKYSLYSDITRDIAILIYEESYPKLPVFKVAKSSDTEDVIVCGKGNSKSGSTDQVTCFKRDTVKDVENFENFYPEKYKNIDENVYSQLSSKFVKIHDSLGATSGNVLMLNRLDANGDYSIKEPSIIGGDSGGPWLKESGNGEVLALGITSVGEYITEKSENSGLSFLDADSLSEIVIFSYGVRLDSETARKAILFANQNGADIRLED